MKPMQNYLKSLMIILCLVLLTSCSGSNNDQQQPVKASVDVTVKVLK